MYLIKLLLLVELVTSDMATWMNSGMMQFHWKHECFCLVSLKMFYATIVCTEILVFQLHVDATCHPCLVLCIFILWTITQKLLPLFLPLSLSLPPPSPPLWGWGKKKDTFNNRTFSYLMQIQAVVKKYDILFIADEVLSVFVISIYVMSMVVSVCILIIYKACFLHICLS